MHYTDDVNMRPMTTWEEEEGRKRINGKAREKVGRDDKMIKNEGTKGRETFIQHVFKLKKSLRECPY